MEFNYRRVSVYIDKDNRLYAIPCGHNPQFNMFVDSDILDILTEPYNDDEIETFLLKSMEKCFSKVVEDINATAAISKHFGKKSWVAAVKGMRHVTIEHTDSDGYELLPWKMTIPKDGYTPLEDRAICLGVTPEKGEISKAFKQVRVDAIAYTK